jgi:hypothetical protein
MCTAAGTDALGVLSSSSSSGGFRHNRILLYVEPTQSDSKTQIDFFDSPLLQSAPIDSDGDISGCLSALTSAADSSCMARCHIYQSCRMVYGDSSITYSFFTHWKQFNRKIIEH